MRRSGPERSRTWPVVCIVLLLAFAARADDPPPPAPPQSAAEAPSAAGPSAAGPSAAGPSAEAPSAAGPSAEAPSNQVGRSIFVVNDVDGKSGDAPPQRLQVNDDIAFAEDIATGADAKTVIEFRDGSTFEIGPDALVRIDSFIFNPEESTSEKSLQVTRGVFRYVSGYVASDQTTKIATSSGTLGIRGSVAAGIVDPEVPDFIYVGEGAATFSNDAGSVPLQPGSAIAVPSPATVPMAPAAMPPAVAAQALQVIERRLPPRQALRDRPAPDEARLRRAGAADLVPVSVQRQRAAVPVGARPLPRAAARGSLAGELGLLVEGNRVHLFTGRQATRTAEQTAFLTRAARNNTNAAAAVRRFTSDARAMRTASTTAATALVLRGVGRAAPSAETIHRVTAASLRANPDAAALINRHAAEALQHRAAAGTSRPGERGEPARGPNGQGPEHGRAAHGPQGLRPQGLGPQGLGPQGLGPQGLGPRDGRPAERHPTERHPTERHPTERHPTDRRQPDRLPDPRANAHRPPEHRERRGVAPRHEQQPRGADPRAPSRQPPGKRPPQEKGDEQQAPPR